LSVPVLMPERVGAAPVLAELEALRPDLIVVAAYGQLLPSRLLALPPKGAINIHPSLLPRYRGAAPIQWAIARGERETGVTLFYLSEKMDAGDIIIAQSVPIADDDTALTLTPRLAAIGAQMLLRVLPWIEAGTAPRTPQDESQATYAPKLKKSDGQIAWTLAAADLRNRIRGFQPWPGVYFRWPRRGLTIRVSQADVEPGEGEPGEILSISGAGPLVACGRGALRLLALQPEGRRRMDGRSFCAGYRPEPGERFS